MCFVVKLVLTSAALLLAATFACGASPCAPPPTADAPAPTILPQPPREGWIRRPDSELPPGAPRRDPARFATFEARTLTLHHPQAPAAAARINAALAALASPKTPLLPPSPSRPLPVRPGDSGPDHEITLTPFALGPRVLTVLRTEHYAPHGAAGHLSRADFLHFDLTTGDALDLSDQRPPAAWPNLRQALIAHAEAQNEAADHPEVDPLLLLRLASAETRPTCAFADGQFHVLLVTHGGGGAGEQVGTTLSLPLSAVGEFFAPGTLERFSEYPPAE